MNTSRRRQRALDGDEGVDRVVSVAAAALLAINRHAKWQVAGTTALVVLYRRDQLAKAFIVGALLNAGLGKVVKRLINTQRPDGSPLVDPGMPSSHAMSLSYFCVHLSLLALWHWSAAAAALVFAGSALYTLAVVFTRVELKMHTWAQVAVGAFCGGLFALGWALLGRAFPEG